LGVHVVLIDQAFLAGVAVVSATHHDEVAEHLSGGHALQVHAAGQRFGCKVELPDVVVIGAGGKDAALIGVRGFDVVDDLAVIEPADRVRCDGRQRHRPA